MFFSRIAVDQITEDSNFRNYLDLIRLHHVDRKIKKNNVIKEFNNILEIEEKSDFRKIIRPENVVKFLEKEYNEANEQGKILNTMNDLLIDLIYNEYNVRVKDEKEIFEIINEYFDID